MCYLAAGVSGWQLGVQFNVHVSRHQIDICSHVNVSMHVHSMSVMRFKLYLHIVSNLLESVVFALFQTGDWFCTCISRSYTQSHHQMACILHGHHGMNHWTSAGLSGHHVPGLAVCTVAFYP